MQSNSYWALFRKYIRPLTPVPTPLAPAGRLKEPVRCLLFDIYGTLFISASGDIGLPAQDSVRLGGIEALLKKYRVQKNAPALLDEFHRAIQFRHAELHNRGVDFPEVRIDQIWQQVLQINQRTSARQFAFEFELITNPAYPMPNLANLLSACRRRKIPMGIISNAQFYTPYLFGWFLGAAPEDLGYSPELIFYSYIFEIAKPSAALFKMAAEKLKEKGMLPSSALYVGNDMLKDIFPAKNVGFQTALFAGDKRSLRLRSEDPRCRDLNPDLVVTDLEQLIKYIN